MSRSRLTHPMSARAWVAALGVVGAVMAAAQMMAQHQHGPATGGRESSPVFRTGEIRGPQGGASATPTVAFDRAGRLWAVWFEASHVYVSSSGDAGRTFGPAVQVTNVPEDVDANGEGRPKIAAAANGDLYASWTRKGSKPYTGDIRFSRSLDGGRTFSPPVTVNDDGLAIGHRFDALHVGPGGTIYLAWIDKRDLEQATGAGHEYHGAALYYALSTDRGATFLPNRKLKENVCECCRIAIDFDGDVPVVFWRDIIDGTTRDHGITRFSEPDRPGTPRRATHDGWKIDACPHHGPSLSISSDGTYHLAWFTGDGPEGAGVFYARSSDRGETLTAPMRVGSADAFGHAFVLSRGRTVYLVWKEAVQPRGMSIRLLKSTDAGRSWSAGIEAARTLTGSDHPFLVARQDQVFLSWFTGGEGLRLIELEAAIVSDGTASTVPSPTG